MIVGDKFLHLRAVRLRIRVNPAYRSVPDSFVISGSSEPHGQFQHLLFSHVKIQIPDLLSNALSLIAVYVNKQPAVAVEGRFHSAEFVFVIVEHHEVGKPVVDVPVEFCPVFAVHIVDCAILFQL